ncbi:probable inactive shikimate kinase like 1, chloroplastic isoform X2 [Nicotiana tomentosiformis]|uniref:probable inactive shikimate kinase like 1, chloroplastic isoform X2 n=1 Tax=Nicotiana tomentosiformis TaxID=4098 RepID=UPI00051B6C1C|nr:probable inactive shikimate kinase like 1, chloroplastic isoform X2 [Nicotiana tomentosiformis]
MKLFQLPQQLWLQQPYAGKSGHSQLPPPTHLPYSIPSLRLKIRTFTPLALSDPGASGLNSSIKSNLGKLLADALRYYYFDSDSVVEEALGGKDAVRSFVKTDLKGFRDSETEVLKQLSSMGRLVIGAGNGAVQRAANLALMRHGISIWIDVPLDMVAKEIVEESFQPPASETIKGAYPEVLTQLTAIYEESRKGYATADTTIALQKVASRLGYDTLDAVTTEDMVLETLKEIERLMRVKKLMEEAARPF